MHKTHLPYILTLLLLAGTSILHGQADDKKQGNVLVIPFNPSMYFCNNDQFICQASNITPGELNKTLRDNIAKVMLGSLKEDYNADQISEKEIQNKKSDVEQLYSIAKYSWEEKPLLAYYKKNDEPNGIKSFFKTKSSKNAPEYLNPAKPNMKKHRYYKAQFSDTVKLKHILSNYGANYVLFIDNFEMETRFKDCIEMQKNVSTRDLYIHYTLLDGSGKYKDGGVVCLTYQSSSNKIDDIMKNTLPNLSGMILQEVKAAIGKI